MKWLRSLVPRCGLYQNGIGWVLCAALATFQFLRGTLFLLEWINPGILTGVARACTLRTAG